MSAAGLARGGLALLLAAFLGACSSDDDVALPRAPEAAACLVNSDCAERLVCAFQRCHVECAMTRDCDGTLRCVGAEADTRICQLEDEAACKSSTDCERGFTCAQDEQCRETCRADDDCTPGQRCTAGVCAEARELDDDGLLPRIASFTSCGNDADCRSGQRCVEQTCLDECRSDRDCPSGEHCADGSCAGEAPHCWDDQDCLVDGQSCVGNRCRCACLDDIDCGAGQTCDGCACQPEPEPECRWDLQCPVGKRCIAGSCDCECREARDCAHGQTCDGCSCRRDSGPTTIHDAVVQSSLDIDLMRGITDVEETLTLTGGLSSTVGLENLQRVKNLTLDSLTLLDYEQGDPLSGLAGLLEIKGTLKIVGTGLQKLSFNPDLRIGEAVIMSGVALSCADAVAFQEQHQLTGTFDVKTSDCPVKCSSTTCE